MSAADLSADLPAAVAAALEPAAVAAARAGIAICLDGVWIGHFGPALTVHLDETFSIVFGPDSPLAGKALEWIFARWDLDPETRDGLVTALDALAAAVCRPPGPAELAGDYLDELRRVCGALPDTL